MRASFGRSAPIGVQVMSLVAITLLVAQLVNAVVVLALPRPAGEPRDPVTIARLLSGAQASDDFVLSRHGRPPADDRVDPEELEFARRLAAALQLPPRQVRVVLRARPDLPSDPQSAPLLPALGPFASGPETSFIAARRSADGTWQWLAERRGWLDAWQQRALLWFAASMLLIAPAALLHARRFTGPVRAFAAAAERIGLEPRAEVMSVEGPAEIEHAAKAFRSMQTRIGKYIDERTSIVAAIAHDLRTPLMRLAFRVEDLPPGQRDAAMRDIAQMQEMIGAALDYVRGETRSPVRRELDLAVLLDATAARLAHEQGRIVVEPHEEVIVRGDEAALERLIANLLQNAVRYGEHAVARAYRSDGIAVLEIDDDGPGVPEFELERVFEPFHRLEQSRNRSSGGVGLGLTIARSIAKAHGGTLELSNRESGLRSTLRLPAKR